jgi:hypothetical protein
MLSIRKTFAAAVATGSLFVGVSPAHALVTPNVPISNLPQTLPLTPSTIGLNALGFNQTNFASIWAGAPSGTTPQLTDVRLFTRGTLSGSFVVSNTNTSSGISVSSPALTFNEKANGMNSATLATTNTTGTVPQAILKTGATVPTTPPGNPPVSQPNPNQPRYCPGDNWVASDFDPDSGIQLWTCTTAQQTTFTINPSSELTSTNWSLIGGGNINGVASSFWSGNTVSIPSLISLNFTGILPSSFNAQFALTNSQDDNYIQYTYNYVSNQVPAPLPVLGAGLAFSFSRRLRRRINSSATLAS